MNPGEGQALRLELTNQGLILSGRGNKNKAIFVGARPLLHCVTLAYFIFTVKFYFEDAQSVCVCILLR